MTGQSSDLDAIRLRKELGFSRWEAISHFLIDGDYLGFNQSNYLGAIAEYEKAWALLATPWQRQVGGIAILTGIADFALQSEDKELASQKLDDLLTWAEETVNAPLHVMLGKLAVLAGKQDLALEQFRCAFDLAGVDAFADEDASCLAFLKEDRLRP